MWREHNAPIASRIGQRLFAIMLTKALDAPPDALTLEDWDSERVSSDCFAIRRRVGLGLVLALGARAMAMPAEGAAGACLSCC
jgi:hypothetical protein